MTAVNPSGCDAPGEFVASQSYRTYVLWLLFCVYVINFVDRQIMTILLQPIKDEFGFSDSQMGLLTGLAFALFYATLGIPIASWADRANRAKIITYSIMIWSLFTAVCGLVQNFWHLLVARIGVGIGEAGCSPPSYSLISDYFPRERRATAISTYSMGIYGGVFVGFLLGGWIEYTLGWRYAFMVVGLPGVLVALVVRLSLREPPRGLSDPGKAVTEPLGIAHTIRNLWTSLSFRHMAVAAALHALVGYGVGGFSPAFLARSHGMSTQAIGTWMAVITAGGGIVGTFIGGYVCDRRMASGHDSRVLLWIPAVSTLIHVPLQLLVLTITLQTDLPLLGPTPVILFLMIPTWLVGAMYLGPTFTMAQGLVSIRERAVAGAVLLFVINLIGLGIGPWLTGVLSDTIMHRLVQSGIEDRRASAEGLRYSLLCMAFVNCWSALHYFLAARHMDRHPAAD